jgi:hypothetical protein
MVIKQLATTMTVFGLGTLLGLSMGVPASLANPLAESVLIEGQTNSSQARQGIPGRRVGGGTRSGLIFANTSESLIALTMPEPLSITLEAQPSFLFYVPAVASVADVEFVLLDEQENVVYETTFRLDDGDAQFVDVDLAKAAESPSIRADENYQWYFSIIPQPGDRSKDVVVHGGIRRFNQSDWLAQQALSDGFSEQLATAAPLAQARMLYQEAGLWHDAAQRLHRLRQSQPNDPQIAVEWSQLLQSAGLTEGFLAAQPAATLMSP